MLFDMVPFLVSAQNSYEDMYLYDMQANKSLEHLNNFSSSTIMSVI